MTISRFSFPTTIHFGPGARKLVADHLHGQAVKRPLIVTDRGIAALPLLKAFVADLPGLDAGIYSEIWGNPVKSQVDNGVAAYRAHRADAVIGLGGGAALDVAKAIAVMATHPGDVLEYAWDHPQVRPIDQPIPHFIALPTTAGTGSEVGRSSVVSDDATHVKKIIFSPVLLAKCVFADPELTVDLPPAITAATGMDALTHLVEAYLSKGFQPLCDGIALQGLRLLADNLEPCVNFARRIAAGETALLNDEEHREARGMMLNAAMMGGVAFQKGLGVTHSLAHALSTVCDLHHGLANGIMIPYAMGFNHDNTRREAVAAYFAAMANEWEMLRFEPADFVAQGDRVAVLGDCAWKSKRTGQIAESPFAQFFTFREGRIAAIVEMFDTATAVAVHGRPAA